MDQDKIGKFIAKVRKDKKLTQEVLAEKLDVNSKSVSRWENGICMPDISLIEKLANVLDVSVSEILKGEELKEMTKKNSDEIVKESISFFQKAYFKKKITIILIGIALFSVSCVLIDTLNAYIFKKSPIISRYEMLEDYSYVDKGLLFDVYYCYHSADVVMVSWKFKVSNYTCPPIKDKYMISVIGNVFIKTYTIEKIESFSEENYQYWTLTQFDGERRERVKVSDLSLQVNEGKKYEIIFKVDSDNIEENIIDIFKYASIYNIVETTNDINQEINQSIR